MTAIKKLFSKIQYNAPVILSFTLISFCVLILNTATGWTNLYLFSVYRSSMADPLFYIRIFGHVLGHANWEHFFSNLVMILLAGPMLEEKYGSKNMLIMVLFTALVTGVINIVMFPQSILLGASGIVFMLILLSSFVNLKKGMIPLTLILCVFVFIGREISAGLLNQDNISQITHIFGGLCGAFFGFSLNKGKLTE